MGFSHLLLLLLFFLGVDGTTFILKNNCGATIWPGILTSYQAPALMNGGLELKAGESQNISAPDNWSGKFWARDGCSFDSQGMGKCYVGDCGGTLHCEGKDGDAPASAAEFVLGSDSDSYDISLVNGYNMEVSIEPVGGDGNCSKISCSVDLNQCPQQMQFKAQGKVVACMTPCLIFNNPMACCTGEFSDPEKCQANSYTEVFKSSCPLAYNFAFDDATKSYTCSGANYVVSFC
ncbi:hypothetical protein DCAR_0934155 [Daucus carota subsp. sativus]|uniref:Uncharacterized protein n=1 Tax=Daucus carota subsp. sativus TaxID=79200 RepID=A0A175YF32_DAUCS|nr:PREDICTED: thaumatin-like protein [Daucus carota subsp. sativus]WOH14635.1 hypothetical protein DCAR_0934155 [Daucus carota subsp. sativus]